MRDTLNQEILASVMIKNLDTGEEIPLIQAEEKLPAGINPLTLHIMRRTKEYITYAEKTSLYFNPQPYLIFCDRIDCISHLLFNYR